MSDSEIYGRMQSAEASNNTLRQEMERMRDRWRDFKSTLGIKERGDGSLDIDYDILVERIGLESWIELRQIGDARYGVRGAPGEKPTIRMRVGAGAA